MGWAQSVMSISGSNSSLFTEINTLLVVYRFCPLSTDNFSHLWCITSILFLLHFLYLRLRLFALIVLGNPWVCTWRKWTRETARSLYSKVLAVSTLPGLKGSSGSTAHLKASLCWEGKLEGCWMEGGWFPFLCGPGNPLLISVHLKDWLSANGKKKKKN